MGRRIVILAVLIMFASGCGRGAKHGHYQEGLASLPEKSKQYSKIRIKLHGAEAIKKHTHYLFVKKYFEKKVVEYIKTKTRFKDVALMTANDQGSGGLIIDVKILDFSYRHAADNVGMILAGGLIGLTGSGKPTLRVFVLYQDGDSKQQLTKLAISQRKRTTNSAIRKISSIIALGLNVDNKSVEKIVNNSGQSE